MATEIEHLIRELRLNRMASCNVEAGIRFGKLDSVPLMGTDFRLGDGLAVSYDKVVEHRKASDFEKQ